MTAFSLGLKGQKASQMCFELRHVAPALTMELRTVFSGGGPRPSANPRLIISREDTDSGGGELILSRIHTSDRTQTGTHESSLPDEFSISLEDCANGLYESPAETGASSSEVLESPRVICGTASGSIHL